MNWNFTLFFIGIAFIAQPGSAQHSSPHTGHAQHEAPKASASTLSGKSLYNISAQWRTSNGKSVTLSSLRESPRLLAMLYTSCSTACPMLVDKMKGVSKELSPESKAKLKMTLVSFDPKRDTPESLTKFAAKQNLDLIIWTLLSPNSESDSNELAGALGVQFKKIKDDFVHSNIIFLIDENGELIASDEGLGKARPKFISQVTKLLGK